jgi:uncharacterized membrane protein required for colicin V production
VGELTDLLLAGFLLFQTWLGWRSGLLWQVAGLASVGFGVMLGAALAPSLGARLLGLVTENPFHAKLLAFLLIAAVVGFTLRMTAVWAEAQSESGVARKERERRRQEDRILGGIFGALKGLVLALVLVAAGVGLAPYSALWKSSCLAPPFATAGARLLPEGGVRAMQEWVEESKEQLCEGLEIQVSPPKRAGRGDAGR